MHTAEFGVSDTCNHSCPGGCSRRFGSSGKSYTEAVAMSLVLPLQTCQTWWRTSRRQPSRRRLAVNSLCTQAHKHWRAGRQQGTAAAGNDSAVGKHQHCWLPWKPFAVAVSVGQGQPVSVWLALWSTCLRLQVPGIVLCGHVGPVSTPARHHCVLNGLCSVWTLEAVVHMAPVAVHSFSMGPMFCVHISAFLQKGRL